MGIVTELLTSNASIVGLFTVLVTLSVSLTKVVEFLIKKALPKKETLSEIEFNKIKDIHALLETIIKKKDDDEENMKEQHEWVSELHRLHSKSDADGVPLWYVPRSFIETQKEIVTILLNISSQMDKSTYILDSLLKRLEELERQIRFCDKNK
jgi:ABC-type Zn2+ transport system substrate-binding protein/surface adhesin